MKAWWHIIVTLFLHPHGQEGGEAEERIRRKRGKSEMEGYFSVLEALMIIKKIIANIDYILTSALQSSKYFTYEATEEYHQ